jgi:hypothetical protein
VFFLGGDAVLFSRQIAMFWRNVLPPSSGSDDEGSTFLQNVDTYTPNYMASHFKIMLFISVVAQHI